MKSSKSRRLQKHCNHSNKISLQVWFIRILCTFPPKQCVHQQRCNSSWLKWKKHIDAKQSVVGVEASGCLYKAARSKSRSRSGSTMASHTNSTTTVQCIHQNALLYYFSVVAYKTDFITRIAFPRNIYPDQWSSTNTLLHCSAVTAESSRSQWCSVRGASLSARLRIKDVSLKSSNLH